MKRTIVSPCGVYVTPANPEVMYETDRRYFVWANISVPIQYEGY